MARSLQEQIDILAMRILTLEELAGMDNVAAVLLARITAARDAKAPKKAPRKKKAASQ